MASRQGVVLSVLERLSMADLRRFVDAQAPVIETALSELRAGHKRTHWMWFVFPQLKVLGRSSMAKYYGLHDLTEARSYWEHPVLGDRAAITIGVEHRCGVRMSKPGTGPDFRLIIKTRDAHIQGLYESFVAAAYSLR